MKESSDLLETLWSLTGCVYLSDLKRSSMKATLQAALRELKTEDFCLRQWRQAAEYLLGEPENDQSAAQIHERLIQGR